MAGAGAVASAAEVVDHDAGTLTGKGQGVLAPQAAARAGDDNDSILHSGREGPPVVANSPQS